MELSINELRIIYDALAYKLNNCTVPKLEGNDTEDVFIRIKAAICLEDKE